MSAEKYREGWVRVVLQVSPDGEFNAVAGDREQGDPLADLPYIGMERLKAAIKRTRNQALEDAANVFDVSAEASRQIAKRRHDARAFEAAREFYQQAERSARSAEIIREMKSAI